LTPDYTIPDTIQCMNYSQTCIQWSLFEERKYDRIIQMKANLILVDQYLIDETAAGQILYEGK